VPASPSTDSRAHSASSEDSWVSILAGEGARDHIHRQPSRPEVLFGIDPVGGRDMRPFQGRLGRWSCFPGLRPWAVGSDPFGVSDAMRFCARPQAAAAPKGPYSKAQGKRSAALGRQTKPLSTGAEGAEQRRPAMPQSRSPPRGHVDLEAQTGPAAPIRQRRQIQRASSQALARQAIGSPVEFHIPRTSPAWLRPPSRRPPSPERSMRNLAHGIGSRSDLIR
jgi:hypothetical protein